MPKNPPESDLFILKNNFIDRFVARADIASYFLFFLYFAPFLLLFTSSFIINSLNTSAMHALEEIEKMSARTLYRELFKNMRFYPSKNRFNILLALREEFRDNANLTDPKKIVIELKKARIGLSHLDLYKKKSIEFVSMYRMKDEEFSRGLNPKNKDFIYF
jgi:hypothetical protein